MWRDINRLQQQPADCQSYHYFFSAANIRSTYCCDGISQLLQQSRGTVSMTTCAQHWNLTSRLPFGPQDVALGTAVVRCHMHEQRLLISRPITRSIISRWANEGAHQSCSIMRCVRSAHSRLSVYHIVSALHSPTTPNQPLRVNSAHAAQRVHVPGHLHAISEVNISCESARPR